MTMEHAAHRPTFWWSVLSALTILAGLLAIAAPMAAGLAATLLVGWFITFSAAIHLWLTFEPQRLSSRLWHVLAAAIYGVGGLYLIARPDIGLLSLTLFVSVMLFVAGIVRVVAYFSLRERSGAHWLLADGALTVLFGTLIYVGWPASSHWAVGTLVGITLVFNGLGNLMFSEACRREAKPSEASVEGHVVV